MSDSRFLFGRLGFERGNEEGTAAVGNDGGIGIPRDEQPFVFERFFWSSNAAERAIQGSGLGLSIAKVIVEAHGGTIRLESGEASGTTVRLELPLASDDARRRARRKVA